MALYTKKRFCQTQTKAQAYASSTDGKAAQR